MRKKMIYTLMGLSLVCLLNGCHTKGSEDTKDNPVKSEQPSSESTTSKEPTASNVNSVPTEDDFSFKELSGLEFSYTSGAGAWETLLSISEDGSFEGSYHDVDATVIYYCDFNGKLNKPEKVNDYTYKLKVTSMKYSYTLEKEEQEEDITYETTTPNGLDPVDELYLYLPGTPKSEVPEGFISWMSFGDTKWTKDDKLNCYGLYNEETEAGFASYKYEQLTIDDELKAIEVQDKELNIRIENEMLTQQELNEITMELYTLWDDKLNDIWARIKDKLDSESMNKLKEEERKWIAYKEKEVEKAGAEFEGGTARPMVENGTAAELTKARVYELAKYLRD